MEAPARPPAGPSGPGGALGAPVRSPGPEPGPPAQEVSGAACRPVGRLGPPWRPPGAGRPGPGPTPGAGAGGLCTAGIRGPVLAPTWCERGLAAASRGPILAWICTPVGEAGGPAGGPRGPGPGPLPMTLGLLQALSAAGLWSNRGMLSQLPTLRWREGPLEPSLFRPSQRKSPQTLLCQRSSGL